MTDKVISFPQPTCSECGKPIHAIFKKPIIHQRNFKETYTNVDTGETVEKYFCEEHMPKTDIEHSLDQRIYMLQGQVEALQSALKRFLSTRPPVEGGREYILKENEDWVFGITEREDGTFSSVWMQNKKPPEGVSNGDKRTSGPETPPLTPEAA